MPCEAHELRHVPLFSLLDDDELAVLAQQVELRTFAPRQRIYNRTYAKVVSGLALCRRGRVL
jgi:signal-transduction protein with cAMP-binding, CBS, and nucleotidyltransferase domain